MTLINVIDHNLKIKKNSADVDSIGRTTEARQRYQEYPTGVASAAFRGASMRQRRWRRWSGWGREGEERGKRGREN
jgi:hypothetical protein